MLKKLKAAKRAIEQRWAPSSLKRGLWNREFAAGHWEYISNTPGDVVYAFIEKHSAGGRILDLGCGAGNTGNELNPAAYLEYIGIDISDVAVQQAIARSEANGRADRNHYRTGDIESYVPDGSFDVILFRESLCYLPARKIIPTLKRLSVALRPHGVFIVRLWDEVRYKAIVNLIAGKHRILQKHITENGTIVLVFR